MIAMAPPPPSTSCSSTLASPKSYRLLFLSHPSSFSQLSKDRKHPFVLEVRAGRRNQLGLPKPQHSKGWLNRRQGDLKELEHSVMEQMKNNSGYGEGRSEADLGRLRVDQAIGQVLSAQANFMRVIVEKVDQDESFTAIEDSSLQNELSSELSPSSDELVQILNPNPRALAEGAEHLRHGNAGQAEAYPAVSSSIVGNEVSFELTSSPDEHAQTLDSNPMLRGEAVEQFGHANTEHSIAPSENCSLLRVAHAIDDRANANSGASSIDGVDNEGAFKSKSESLGSEKVVESKMGRELLCVVRAVLKKIKRKVMVGDRVLVSGVDWSAGRGMVEDVFERKSQISDPPVANADHLLVLFAMDKPRLDPFTLSRFLVEAESTHINFTLVLNKVDLMPLEAIERWEERLHHWGYKPIFCSAKTQAGIDSLVAVLKGKTSVVVGPSGVGKSSLINAFRMEGSKSLTLDEKSSSCGKSSHEEVPHNSVMDASSFQKLLVKDVSHRSGRGKHTTRNVSLFYLPLAEGVLADTPGFSHPSLGNVTSGSLAQYFPEVVKGISTSEAGGCAFADCLHVGEPNCVVGGDWERYPHYLSMLEEVKKREEFQKKTLGTKRESDVRYKVGAFGIKQAEPMLVSKTHRRLSRKHVKQTLENDMWEDEQIQQIVVLAEEN